MTGLFGAADHLRGRLFQLIGLAKYHLLERQFIHTMRIGLVATTLALTLLTAALIAKQGEMGLLVVGAVAALCGLILVYRHFSYAVMALILTTTIAAPEIPRDMTTTLLLLILLTLIWLTRLLLVERSFQSLRPALPNRFIPLFILAVIVSFLWSLSYADPQIIPLQNDKLLPRLVTALVMILSPVALLLFGNFIRTITEIKWVIWYFIIFGAFALLPRLFNFELPPNFNTGGQLPAWVGIFALGQSLFNDKLARWQRLALLALVAGWVFVAFVLENTWLSGWTPLLAGVAIILVLRSRIMIVVFAAVIVAYGMANLDAIEAMIQEETVESGESRLAAGNFTVDIANRHFLFGTGPTGYYFYMRLYLVDLFQLSHNNYIDIYAQTGIFGFASYLLLWGAVGWTVWRTYRMVPRRGFEGGLAASLVAAYVITLGIMMLGDWVIPFTYTQTMRGLSYTIWPWLWAGLAIALGYIARQDQTPRSSQTS
jgi:hypothetical protein